MACGSRHRNDAGAGVVRRLPSSWALVLNVVSEFANWNAVVMPDLGPLCTATSPLTLTAAFAPLPSGRGPVRFEDSYAGLVEFLAGRPVQMLGFREPAHS